ncbi:AEC family transporter [Bradyrhizobium sp. BR 10261]|uniref:AEC family transporter n=1 Tax=Bradyrhizobium sp. BR 10261 TaxID=2749992 RepID=UPI001C64A66B|nr:AEC family transporter [Bradyrhizobium sp. BR 10261]MBW7966663.1 AEC family transporter [Bradyrhizobium sp. BR 10261]
MTLTVLVPIFAMLALGFAAARSGLLTAEANGGLLKLVACFAIPALLFRSLAGGAQAAGDGEIALIYLLGCAALLVIAFIYGRLALGLSLAECVVFGMGVIYSNSSLIGVPIAQALLGNQGVALLSQIIAIHTIVLIPLATLLLAFGNSARGGSKALISAISNPMTVALAAGLVWRRTGLAVPEPIDHVIGMLAAAAPALSLIALGATVARVPLPTNFAAPVAAVVLKLVIHPLLIWSIAHAMGLPKEQILIATMTAALPPGINVYVLASHFGRHAEDAARSFALATTLSAVSISIVVQAIAWR